jgi:hypothetical protein
MALFRAALTPPRKAREPPVKKPALRKRLDLTCSTKAGYSSPLQFSGGDGINAHMMAL